MPVTDLNGKDLEERGIQYLWSQKHISACIKSVNNIRFQVTVQAKILFVRYDVSNASDEGSETGKEDENCVRSLHDNEIDQGRLVQDISRFEQR